MQTFLPFQDFEQSARVLDYRRLGKQRIEAKQILMALLGESKGWVNHPATKMWRGFEGALGYYGAVMCIEWIRRGYKDTTLPFFLERQREVMNPSWLGDEKFHLSHQSNLVRKDKDFYQPLFPGVSDNLEYVWPV